ncbi:ABC-type multidrug transport system fused ATPase/permease subunit [Pseudomonas sp. BIGb0408]|uniref:ABC-type multidrug transport system fused ATPase/permease subunit n=1 Tax=Phytopseudomonas flavescens TaxID=29435 RepID=A0A7Y9XKI4_9GAMM|nr:ABC transporter ATP-binding protein [Pseudomonas sp. BIGb0408]MCW2292384.1 ABC-type multidrug transport system fused ATPase/permease subunit [Pseudomonas sp. BIGb0408]NYH73045.1 ABC-type multidrug transport system fused ATPase/permease subunit [Pseudomonas flavescens]
MLPYLLKLTAEAFSSNSGALQTFWIAALSYAFCWTFVEVLRNVKGIFTAGILARAATALMDQVLSKKLATSFYKQRELNHVIITENINRGSLAFSDLTVSVFWTLLPVFLELILALYFLQQSLGTIYALIFFCFVIMLIILSFAISVRSRNVHTEVMHVQNKVSEYMLSRLSTLLDIRLNSAHSREQNYRNSLFDEYVKTIASTNRRIGLLLTFQVMLVGFLLGIAVLALTFYKGASGLSSGDFILVAGYIGMLTLQLRLIAGSLIDIQRNIVFLKLVVEYSDLQVVGFEDLHPPIAPSHVFEAVDLTCTRGGRNLFSELSFKVQEGESLAITAPSGAGKTTLLNILLGLEAPEKGHIFFSGSEVTPDNSDAIARRVAVVPQRPALIPGSVEDNLRYGLESDLSDEILIETLQALEVVTTDLESARKLLKRDIRNGGAGLSGGEIQRICIARALLRNKDIIVLDEPTAALGEELSLKIIKLIKQRCETVIITTHSSLIREAADRYVSLSCSTGMKGKTSGLARL